MKMKRIITASILAVVLTTGMVGIAVATHGGEHPTPGDELPDNVETAADFIALLSVITDWIFVVLLVVSVIFIVLAGFQFITGGGDPAAISEARSKLIYAAVGIGVALLARGVPAAIQNIVNI